MSRALKCDRCGAYFDPYEITDDTSVILAGKTVAKLGRITADLSFYGEDIFHLCDECQKQLELFLANERDIVFLHKTQ